MRIFANFVVLWAFPTIGLAARILAFLPLGAHSHNFFYQPFVRGLAERGHQIDYYSPFPMKIPHENITHIPVENVLEETMTGLPIKDHWRLPALDQLFDLLNVDLRYVQLMCKLKSVKDLLNSNETYDLLLHESLYHLEASDVFKHKFNIPSVALLAMDDFFQMNDHSGLLINPSYMVSTYTVHTDQMDFLDRLHNTYLLVGSLIMQYFHLEKIQSVMDECYTYPGWESRPHVSKLIADQSLVLVNNHPSVGFPFPRPPHVKEVGGAVVQPRRPLPQDLENFMKEAEHGVVYFSLGTVIKWEETEANLREVFLNVFSQRKERILWKCPGKEWQNLPANVKISSWFPQQDILAHPNVKLFITHGGLQSTFETVHHAVPVIAIPSFADQVRNSLAMAQHGYGVQLLRSNVTESSLTWALDEVLYQPKYQERVQKGSALIKDRLHGPVDEGIFWIEHVLHHGKVLQPAGARLNFIQRHCLDVLGFLGLVFVLVLYATTKIVSFFIKAISTWASERFNKKKLD